VGIAFGAGSINPAVSASTYTWQLSNLGHIEEEPGMPSSSPPRLGVNLVPAVSGSAASLAPEFKEWAGLARWHSELTETQAEPDAAIRAKAAALIGGAETTLAKIRAVAHFVQGINYVSVQMGVARGGGYRPHPAPEILRRLYGDCKDKTTLMRSLLRAANIDSHAVAIFSGDRDFVRPEWVSPHQFNHMILAVQLEKPEELPAVARLDNLGSVLFFDPTDPVTPVGELPEDQQVSYGLLVASQGGALVKMPTARPDRNRFQRRASITVAPDAKLRADLVEIASGVPALRARRYLLRSQSERTRMLEGRFSASVPGVAISSVRMSTEPSGAVETQLHIEAPHLVKVISKRMWLLRLGFVDTPIPLFTAGKRVNPVQLSAVSADDTFECQPPDGFNFDGTPEAVRVDSAYGVISIQWAKEGPKLRMVRRFELFNTVVPPTDYAALRRFLDEARSVSAAHVILVRQ
jgi:hypothetical protein